MSNGEKDSVSGFLRSRFGIGVIAFLAVGGYFLWTEHRAHVIEAGPLILILLFCVGVHFFMHGASGQVHRGRDDGEPNTKDRRH